MCCVPVQVIVADTFTNLSAQYLGADALPSQRPFVLLLTGALVLLMCFPRNLQALGKSPVHPQPSRVVLKGMVLSSAAAVQYGSRAPAPSSYCMPSFEPVVCLV